MIPQNLILKGQIDPEIFLCPLPSEEPEVTKFWLRILLAASRVTKITIPQNFHFEGPEKSRDVTGGIKFLIKNIFTRAYDKKVTLLQNLILKALREPEIGLPLPEKEGNFI